MFMYRLHDRHGLSVLLEKQCSLPWQTKHKRRQHLDRKMTVSKKVWQLTSFKGDESGMRYTKEFVCALNTVHLKLESTKTSARKKDTAMQDWCIGVNYITCVTARNPDIQGTLKNRSVQLTQPLSDCAVCTEDQNVQEYTALSSPLLAHASAFKDDPGGKAT